MSTINRNKPILLAATLAFVVLVSPRVSIANAADGFYEIIDTAYPIQALDGSWIGIGKKIDEKISTASIRSMNNSNETFYLSLEKEGAFSNDNTAMVYCATYHCARFTSGGNSNNKTFTIGASIPNRISADKLAKSFGIALKLRQHPGHAFLTRFIPAADKFAKDAPLNIKLEIKNIGDKPVTFQDGGQNRGERNNQFGFTASNGVVAIPDTGNPQHHGGLSVNKTLRPGEAFEKEIDLRKWFTFKESGTYFITGTFELPFFNSEDKEYFVLWEDFAAAKFSITIE